MITRSREDGEALSHVLAARGIDVLMAPLLEIHVFPGDPLSVVGTQALLATSANGVRAFAARNPERALPVFAVGDATACLARAVGFSSVESAAGDVHSLAEVVRQRLKPEAGTLLHVAGTKVAGDLRGDLEAHGYRYRREVLYEARRAHRLEPEALEAVRSRSVDGVLLYSPRTASIFCDLAAEGGIIDDLGTATAFCLSDAVARRVAAMPWRDVRVAERPDQEAMLALLEKHR